jgi:hypothetical protein
VTRQYWARVYSKAKKPVAIIGPRDDRDTCVREACGIALNHKRAISVMHGYGTFGPSFDIRWANAGYRNESWRQIVANHKTT